MVSKDIRSLQVLRGLAALVVVAHHASRAVTVNKGSLVLGAPWLTNLPALRQFGACGVDIFFVLSGFLMIYISDLYNRHEKSPAHFLLNRLIRIWPMYAVVTMWFLAPQVLAWLHGGQLSFDLKPLRLASLLFLPSHNSGGLLQPILGIGWTLNYEVAFYIAFVAALLIPRGSLLWKLIGLLTISHLIGWALDPASTLGGFLGNSIVFEFIFGAVIGEKWKRGALRMHPAIALLPGLAVLILTAGFVPADYWRFTTTGLGAAAVFVGFLNLEDRVTWPKAIASLGDASYSIYLVHIVVIYNYALPRFGHLSAYGIKASADLVALGLIVTSLLVGYLAYRFIERPLLALCRRVIAAILHSRHLAATHV